MNTRRSWFALLLAAAGTIGMLSSPAAAQEDDETPAERSDEEIQVLAVDIDDAGVAQLTVAIPPAIGDSEPGSTDFGLVQNGQRQAVLVGELKDEVDVVLVIDTSGSMKGDALADTKLAALSFVSELPEESRIAVIGFGPTPELASELTTDRTETAFAINSLQARGETALWDAMVAAGDLLVEEGRTAPYIVVLSDGGDTASTANLGDSVDALSAGSYPIGLYVVTVETAESDHTALNEAVAEVSGQVLTTDDTETLRDLYTEVAGRLTSRYSVRFVPDGRGDVVLSVAVGDAIATATASLGEETLPTTTDRQDSTLNEDSAAAVLEPQLGTVLAPAPGLLGGERMLWIGAGATFLGLVAALALVAVPAMKAQPIDSIRSVDASGRVNALNQRMSGSADRLIRKHDDSGSLDRTLDAAGLDIRAGEFVVVFGVLLVCTGAIGSVLFGPWAAVGLIGVASVAGVVFVTARVSKRRAAFADQLQNTISIMTGSLRAGRGLPQALEMVAQEAPSPTADEFRRVVIETRVGRDPIEALDAVAERMDSLDLDWISQAVAINRELGGDLIELLENVANTVRARNRIALQVRSLSAEGRISGWVMLALPVAMYAYLTAVNRDYIALLHTTTGGRSAALVGIVAMIFGGVWIRKLVNIRF